MGFIFFCPWRSRAQGAHASEFHCFPKDFHCFETPPWPVLPGMTATVLLSMATPSDAVIQLPLSAVQSDAAGNFFVWTVERDTSQVTKRPIEVGVPSRKQVPVLSGLELGEQVVAAGGAWLYDGMQVRPLGDN